MTLSNDINTTSSSFNDIKNAINNKGGSASGSITTYPSAISNIPIPDAVINREVSSNGTYQMPTSSFTFSLPSNATDLGDYALFYAFYGCTSLTSVNLSSLRSIGIQSLSSAFQGCTSLTSVDLSSLSIMNKYSSFQFAFRNCTSLTTLSFPALTSTSFGSSTSQFTQMLFGTSRCTVHFPSNLQSVIGSWTDVITGFGGTNTTVLFDLPATT